MQTSELSETCTLTEFQQHAEEHINRVIETRQPLFLAANGKADVVLLDAESYGQMLDAIEYAETVEGFARGWSPMRQGKGRPAEEFFAEMRQKYNIPAKP